MLSRVLIKTRNGSIPTMKIRQIDNKPAFFNSTPWKIRCSLNPKAQAVNKANDSLDPEPYYPEFFKSRALTKLTRPRHKEIIVCTFL